VRSSYTPGPLVTLGVECLNLLHIFINGESVSLWFVHTNGYSRRR